MHVIPVVSRKITSFPSIIIQHTKDEFRIWLGGTCGTTQTWWSTRQRIEKCGLPTCLSPLKQWSGPWTKMSSTVGKTTTHASLPLLILGPTMLCCLAKILPIAKGETIQAYYGPASGFLHGQYMNRKFSMLNDRVHWGDQQHHVQMFTVNNLIFISDVILF
jgi:hypothetical protein